ncbi:MAG: hypothetical protein JOZ62_18305 [Acidobacteriaceae bacterium]|nr:hypothetical protein [Acidobacteriaceae bacterium]
MDRYAETAVLGLTLLICDVLDRFMPPRAAIVFAVTLVLSFLVPPLHSLTKDPRASATGMPVLSSTDEDPFVIANPLVFLQVAHYAPAAIRKRLYYVADPATAAKLPDFLPELSLVAGRNFLPFHIVDYERFVQQHATFWISAGSSPNLEWLPQQLLKDGYRLSLVPHPWIVYRAARLDRAR